MTTENKTGKEKSSKGTKGIDPTGPSCSHVKKLLKGRTLGKVWASNSNGNPCQDCSGEEVKTAATIWMCLHCGHRGCGQNSENKHAVRHHESTPPRSGLHCLVLSTEDWGTVWCYSCDIPVQYTRTDPLAGLLDQIIQTQTLPDRNNGAGENKSNVKKNNVLPFNNGQKKQNVQGSGTAEGGGSSSSSSSVVSVKGLSNLGNTCFFNAVVQNLSQTLTLRRALGKVTAEKTSVRITPAASSDLEPIAVRLDRPGSLTTSMCQLLKEMQDGRRDVVTPQGLFTQVCKRAGKFKGSQQHDSQELLRYLLDGVRAEETKRLRSGILEALKKTGNAKLLKVYEKNACPRNVVDEVFGGEMTSTIMCRECNTATMITERFLDLSLPVSEEAKAQQKSAALTADGQTSAGAWKCQQKKARKVKPKQGEKQTTLANRFAALEDLDGGMPETDEDEAELADELGKMSLEEAVEDDVPAEPIKQRTVLNQDPELAFRTLATRTAPAQEESSLQSCLFRFTEVENLTQANRLLCATCTERRTAKSDSNGSKDNRSKERKVYTESNGSKERKVYTDSFKQILISAPPQVLTLHLKRAQQVGSALSKVNKHVEFPQTLDLAPFCAAKCKSVPERLRQVLYGLYGVVDHRGSMKAGHHTASVKARPQRPAAPSSNGAPTVHGDADARKGSWFHVSDAHVKPVSESTVQSSQAYLLFYERI